MNKQKVNRAVRRFAAAMKAELLKLPNMAKEPRWPGMPLSVLAVCCQWKAGLVERAINTCSLEEIQKQAVDLANYAMMIYDNASRKES
jgi:hypothetical protein